MRLLLFTMHHVHPGTQPLAPIALAFARTPTLPELSALVTAKMGEREGYLASAIPRVLELVGVTTEWLARSSTELERASLEDGVAWPSVEREHAGMRFSLQLLDVEFLPAELDGRGWAPTPAGPGGPVDLGGLRAMRAGMARAGLEVRDGQVQRRDTGALP